MIFRNKIHQHGSSNLRMSENAHRKERSRAVNLLNKFLLPSEAPLSLQAFSACPPHGPPTLGKRSRRNPRSCQALPGKPQKVIGKCKATLGTILSEKDCFPLRQDPVDRAGRGEGARRQCPGPGAGRDRGWRRLAVEEPQVESAAQRSPTTGGRRRGCARRGAAAPSFRRAAPSRAPARKEACLRAGKGREAAGRSAEPPRTERARGEQGNTKDLRGALGRGRLQSMLLKVVAPAQAGEEPRARGWKLAMPPYRK